MVPPEAVWGCLGGTYRVLGRDLGHPRGPSSAAFRATYTAGVIDPEGLHHMQRSLMEDLSLPNR